MSCETCGGWPAAEGGRPVIGGHNRLCPFAPIPPGYRAEGHGMDFSHPSGKMTFDGTYPTAAGERKAGYKSPPPPGSGGES